jgi:hypothetical protein
LKSSLVIALLCCLQALDAGAAAVVAEGRRAFPVHVTTDTTRTPTPARAFEPLAIPEPEQLRDPLAARRRVEREPRRDPVLHALQSFVVPGWGQGALGETAEAFGFATVFLLSVVLASEVVELPFVDDPEFSKGIGFGLWGTAAALAGFDAHRRAERLNREYGYELDDAFFDDVRARRPGLRMALIRRDF